MILASCKRTDRPPGKLKKIMLERHKAGYYKAPERLGIAYMLSTVLRTYFDPEKNDDLLTVNYPHVKYHAPHVSSEDIGAGKLGGMDPIVILPGHHGYMIQAVGVTERAAINKEYEGMLTRLCKINELWCVKQ